MEHFAPVDSNAWKLSRVSPQLKLSHTAFCAPNVSQSEQTSIFISFTMEAPFQKVVFVLSWGRRQANEAKYIIG